MQKLRNWLNNSIAAKIIICLTFPIGMAMLFSSACTFMQYTEARRNQSVFGLPAMLNYEEFKQYKNNTGVVRLGHAFFCTGFVASAKYVITAAHCVDKVGEQIVVSDSTDTFLDYGKVVGIYDQQDIALIRIDIEDRVKPYKADFTGEISTQNPIDVSFCGFPAGQPTLLCAKGKLTGIYFFLRSGEGVMYPGMSGGPVFSSSGIVLGVNHGVTVNKALMGPLVGLPEKFNILVEQR